MEDWRRLILSVSVFQWESVRHQMYTDRETDIHCYSFHLLLFASCLSSLIIIWVVWGHSWSHTVEAVRRWVIGGVSGHWWSEAERETGGMGKRREREEEREAKQKRGSGCFRRWQHMYGNIATTGIGENCFESIAPIYLCLVFLLSKTQRTDSALLRHVWLLLCVVVLFIGLLQQHFINHLSIPSFTFKRNSFHQ